MQPIELRKLFNYNKTTGELTYRRNPSKTQAWNDKHAGKPALNYLHPSGTLFGNFNGTTASAHRVIWAWWYGEWPLGAVYHANGNRADNRIANLRSGGKLADVL